MKKKYLKIAAFAAALLPVSSEIKAQNYNNWFISIADGIWDSPSTWNKWKTNPNNAYIPNGTGPGKGIPRTTVTHNIRFGTRIEGANYTAMDKTLVISGAKVYSNAVVDDSVRLVRFYGNKNQLSTATTPLDTSLYVEAGSTFGGLGKDGWIVLQSLQGDNKATDPSTYKTNTIAGEGTIQIAGLRVGALSTGLTDSIVIDANMTITGNNNVGNAYGFSAYYNGTGNSAIDSSFVVIKAGRTVKLIDSAFFHMRSNTTSSPAGKINYYIDGVLDASGSTGFSNVIASPVTVSSVTGINVNGLFKLGRNFNTLTGAVADSGKLVMNINNGGVVNATAVATPNANFGAKQWFTIGTGVFKRYVGATDTIFAVTTSATTNNSVLLNTTTADTFSVSVGAANYAWVAGNVQKEWKVKKTATGNAAVKASFMWTTADQSGGFNPTTASVMVYTGAQWKEYAATVTGAGTLASPYKAATNTAIDSIQYAYVTAVGAGVPNPVGIKNVKANNGSVVIAPNPVVNSSFTLQLKGAVTGKYVVNLYNITGQKVYGAELSHVSGADAHNITLPSALTTGVYQLSVTGEGLNATQKVIIP